MPWNARDTMTLRLEFVHLALQPDANRRELCRRFGVSPKTAYKWLARHAEEGDATLVDRSRRPRHSPARTAPATETKVIALRRAHPAWGGRKIVRRLVDLGYQDVPAPSTVTDILRRHGLIGEETSTQSTPWKRFEHPAPNQLWQIDFKGYFDTPAGRCHPLTVLDDHSRFNLVLAACARTDHRTVQPWLTQAFRRYGLPVRLNADNGAPWGAPREHRHGISTLTAWLIRLGIRVSHSRPAHPQDQRQGRAFSSLAQGRGARESELRGSFFGTARLRSLAHGVQPRAPARGARPGHPPGSHHRVSVRAFPEVLPPIEYGPDDHVLHPDANGWLRFHGRALKMPKALHHQPVAFRPRAQEDGVFEVYFCHQRFLRVDLREPARKE